MDGVGSLRFVIMILTCPECATCYSVDEQRLGPQGRTVRCASCGASWRADPPAEAPLELTPSPEPAAEFAKPVPDTVHGQFRAKVEAKRRTREAVTAGVVWGALVAGFGVLMLTAVVFRVQVVRLWPHAAGAYAAVHMPVNPLGVAPENIQAATGLENGRMALVVTGQQRNVDTSPRPGAPMRVSLFDKGGHRLTSRVLRPTPGDIAPGDARPFRVSFIDPPIDGSTVGVDFLFEPSHRAPRPARKAASRAVQAASASPAPLKLRGGSAKPAAPAPVAKLAQPLPPDSKYALPPAARAEAEVAPKLRPRD